MTTRDDILIGPIEIVDLDLVEESIRDVLGATCERMTGAAGVYLAVTFGRKSASAEGLRGFVRGVLWRRGRD